MNSRSPSTRRSQARTDRILTAAADILIESGDPSALTMVNVAQRSDLAVATVYRYFSDRDAIFTTLFDHATNELDRHLIERFLKLEKVTLLGLLDVMMSSYFEFFMSNKRAVALWFGSRRMPEVMARVKRRYAYMGEWFIAGTTGADLVSTDVPEWGGESTVWLGDAMFQFIFLEERSDTQCAEIFEEWMGMLRDQVSKYVTPLGKSGVSPEQFIEQAGAFTPPGSALERMISE